MSVTVRLVRNLATMERGPVTEVDPGGLVSETCPPELIGREPEELRCILNGAAIRPMSRAYMRTRDGDEVTWAPEVRAPLVPIIVTTLVSTALSYAVGKIFGPKPPGQRAEDSQHYAFDRIQNTARNGVPIPVVYGRHRVGGQYLATDVGIYFARSSFSALIGLGEGPFQEIAGQTADGTNLPASGSTGLTVNDSPAEDFGQVSGVEQVFYSVRMGNDSQDPIQIVQEEDNNAASGQQLTPGVPRHATIETVSKISIKINFPDGLSEQRTMSAFNGELKPNFIGDIYNFQPSVAYFRRRHRVSPAGAWSGYTAFEVSGHTASNFDAYETFEVAAGTYDVEVERLAVANWQSVVIDGKTWYVFVTQGSTSGTANYTSAVLVEVVSQAGAAVTFPHLALIGVTGMASEKLYGGTPTITVIVKGRKVRIWDGAAWSVAWSDNPAWCLFDLLTNKRFGLGNVIDEDGLDPDNFKDFADYCEDLVDDGAGGTHKRHLLNIVFDGSKPAWEAAQDVCRLARASLVKNGDEIRVKIDKAESPVQLFTKGNVRDFSLRYLSVKDRANFIEVQYLNEDNNWEQDVAQAESIAAQGDADPTLHKETIALYGITRRGHAHREAIYHLNVNRYVTRWMSFKVGVEALAVEAGDVIRFQHDVPQWGTGGRTRGGSLSTIVLDQDVIVEAGPTYQVLVKHPDDSIEIRTVADAPGTYRTLSVTVDFTTAPGSGEVFAFGETDILVKPFRVVKITRDADLDATLDCAEYDVNVYSDSLDLLPSVTYTALPNPRQIPPDVTDLALEETADILADGSRRYRLAATWNLPLSHGTNRAKVWWRRTGDAHWTYVGVFEDRRGRALIDAGFVADDAIDVAVASVSLAGAHKDPDAAVIDSITLAGIVDQPPDPEGFDLDQLGDILLFRWDKTEARDILGYEIRIGRTWEAGVPIVQDVRTNKFETSNYSPGTQQFMLKARNSAGIYSNNPAVIVADIDPRVHQNVLTSREESAESWDGTASNFSITAINRLRQDASAATATYTTPIVDAGAVVRSRVLLRIDLSMVDIVTTVDDFTFQVNSAESEARTIDGPQGVEHLTLTTEYRTSDDNVIWTDWAPFVAGEYVFRYFQSRLTVASDDPDTFVGEVREYETVVDVDDVLESDRVTVPNTGLSVTFAGTFHVSPRVVIEVVNAQLGDYKVVENHSVTGFDITCYDNNGVAVERTVDWIARGY